MKLSTAQKIMKIVGILTILTALLVIVFGALAIYGYSSAASGNTEAVGESVDAGALLIGGILMIGGGLVDLVTGILAVLSSKNGKFAKTTFILAVISAIYSVANSLINYSKQGFTISNVISLMVEIVMAVLLCVAANTVKVAYEEGRDA